MPRKCASCQIVFYYLCLLIDCVWLVSDNRNEGKPSSNSIKIASPNTRRDCLIVYKIYHIFYPSNIIRFNVRCKYSQHYLERTRHIIGNCTNWCWMKHLRPTYILFCIFVLKFISVIEVDFVLLQLPIK